MFPKILIVDDVPLNVEMLEHVLQAEGFRTLSAVNGAMALEITRAERPDLILLDILMPDENGFETCARLKSDPATVDIPVIFLSALDDVKNKVKALKVGGVDYVSKPVHSEEVLARVRVHLRIRENSRRIVRENQARLERFRDARDAVLVRPGDCPGASFAVYHNPVEGGGDFYDVVAVDAEVFGYFAAEITGEGVSSAFIISAIKALLRQYAGPMYSPEDTMRGVDAVVRQMLGEAQHLTACYAHLNRRTQRLSVVSAGHPPPIVVSDSGNARTLDMDGTPLGMFSSLVLQHKEITIHRGDRFYLYTDGLIEGSTGGRRREGMERLVDACLDHRCDSLEAAVSAIARDIESERSVQEDLLLLGIAVTP